MLTALQRNLHSSAGDAGLIDIEKRLEPFAEPLADAWLRRDEEKGFTRLWRVLTEAIKAADKSDITASHIRLRPTTDGEIPVGVVCKMARAILEHLSAGAKAAERRALEALGEIPHERHEFQHGYRAALAELSLEAGDIDQAIALIDANLSSHSSSPYSQQLLYRALLEKGRRGANVDETRVSLTDLSTRFCEQPFTTILTLGGRNSIPSVHVCGCAAFLPYPINSTPPDENAGMWNGPDVQEIRRSILEGDYSYCSPLMCPYLVNGTLPKRDEVSDPIMRDIIDNNRTVISSAPRRISLGHDDSCNIACPSCRTEIIVAKNSAREAMDAFVDRHILTLMENASVELFLSGDGDPIGSKHYRRLLHNLDPQRHGGVDVYLQSNGLLITPKEWEQLSSIHHLIKGMIISIDAAERETYEDLRRPGKWETLTSNMEFIANLRRSGAIWWLGINFVVQKKNYQEMPAFVELGQRWSVDRVLFSKLYYTERAGTLESADFKANAIADEDHPEHWRLVEVLRNPILRSKIVDMFNIAGAATEGPAGEETSQATDAAAEEHKFSEPNPAPVSA